MQHERGQENPPGDVYVWVVKRCCGSSTAAGRFFPYNLKYGDSSSPSDSLGLINRSCANPKPDPISANTRYVGKVLTWQAAFEFVHHFKGQAKEHQHTGLRTEIGNTQHSATSSSDPKLPNHNITSISLPRHHVHMQFWTQLKQLTVYAMTRSTTN